MTDPDETRTRNLLIQSQTPYTLGHEATDVNVTFVITRGKRRHGLKINLK